MPTATPAARAAAKPMKRLMLKAQTVDRSVYELALDRIRHAYATYDHVAVSLSGGKDSTVVLELTIEVARELGRLPVRALFFDEEAIPQQTEDYVRRQARRPEVELEWYCPPMRYMNACSSEDRWWYPWAPEERELWVRPLPPEAIVELPGYVTEPREARLYHHYMNHLLFFPERHGNAIVLLGIRAAESMMRRRATLTHVGDSWIQPVEGNVNGALNKGYPIYDWRTPDVWTAISRFSWDYNRAYDLMAMHGISPHHQRISSPFHVEAVAALKLVKACYPEVADRYLARVPGARTAAMYGTTDLYGRGGLPEKPMGVRWIDFIATAIKSHPPDRHEFLAKRVATFLRKHRKRTAEPIVEHHRHPESGLTWRWLLKLAIQDDLFGRKQSMSVPRDEEHVAEYERVRTAYLKELAEIKAAGRIKEITL